MQIYKSVQPSSIKSWPETERPREKLLARGSEALADAELIAIFLRTGLPGKSALQIARDLLNETGGVRALFNLSREQACSYRGIGPAKYVQFQAALELGKRYLYEELEKSDPLLNPETSKKYLTMRLRDRPYELFYVMYLDSKNRIIHQEELFRGTIDSANVPIREVVKEGLKHNAAALIVAHNHPSGVAEPSMADKSLTLTMQDALKLVGIRLLDHLIVGESEVTSLAEEGVLN